MPEAKAFKETVVRMGKAVAILGVLGTKMFAVGQGIDGATRGGTKPMTPRDAIYYRKIINDTRTYLQKNATTLGAVPEMQRAAENYLAKHDAMIR